MTSDEMQTWRVECEGGEVRDVFVREVKRRGEPPYFRASAAGRVTYTVNAIARDAVHHVARLEQWSVIATLAPGVKTRAEMERERDEAIARASAAEKRAEWFRAAHMLLAQSHLVAPVAEGASPFVYNFAEATAVDGVPALCVLVNDTFAYATADAEHADYADAPELLRLAASEGWPGLVRWVMARRHEKGDPHEPLLPVGEAMATLDGVRRERDEALRLLRAAAHGELPRCNFGQCGHLATRYASKITRTRELATICDECHAPAMRRGWAKSEDWPDLPYAATLRAALGAEPALADAGDDAEHGGARYAPGSCTPAAPRVGRCTMTHPPPAPQAPIPAELLAAVEAARPHITDASLVADIDEAVEAGDRWALWRALDRWQTAWRGVTRSMRATQELARLARPDVADLSGAADRVRRGIEGP